MIQMIVVFGFFYMQERPSLNSFNSDKVLYYNLYLHNDVVDVYS